MSKVLVIDALFPDPLYGAGFPRTSQIFRVLSEEEGLTFHFLALCQDWSLDHDFLRSLLPESFQTTMGLNDQNIEEILMKELELAKTIWISRFPIYQLILQIQERTPHIFHGVKIVYDSECLEAYRTRMREIVSGRQISEAGFNETLESEMILARRADAVIAVSKQEEEIFRSQGCHLVSLISHSVILTDKLKSLNGRSDMLFVGRLKESDSPNIESINWFAENCYPDLLKKNIRLRLVGPISSSHRENFEKWGMETCGPLKELQPSFEAAKVFIAPTRFASGIPIKLLDAAAAGLPIVATRLLCQQLGWVPGQEILVADTAEEFIDRIAELFSNDELWYSLQSRAYRKVQEDYSAKAFRKSFEPILNFIHTDLIRF
jgi:glycosyltransferase involved in cell wall biosynthesis